MNAPAAFGFHADTLGGASLSTVVRCQVLHMIKVIYLAVVLVVLSPCVFAAIDSILGARGVRQIQRDQQSRTGDSVYVTHLETTVGWGPFALLQTYPHVWAAILFLAGFIVCAVSLVFLFFVRPS